jgi:hypothetical protein
MYCAKCWLLNYSLICCSGEVVLLTLQGKWFTAWVPSREILALCLLNTYFMAFYLFWGMLSSITCVILVNSQNIFKSLTTYYLLISLRNCWYEQIFHVCMRLYKSPMVAGLLQKIIRGERFYWNCLLWNTWTEPDREMFDAVGFGLFSGLQAQGKHISTEITLM